MSKDKWMQRLKIKKGAFKAQAAARGESTRELAAEVKSNPEKFSPKTRKRATLARTFFKAMRRKKRGR